MITLGFPGRLVVGSLGDYTSKRTLMVLAMTPPRRWGYSSSYTAYHTGARYPCFIHSGPTSSGGRGSHPSAASPPFRMIGSVVGPIFAGYIFDDYRFAFNVFSVFALLSIRGPSS